MKQRADIRVVAQQAGKHSLMATATLRGYDLYVTSSHHEPIGAVFKSSYHESGQRHLKIQGNLASDPDHGIPLDRFTGAQCVAAGGANPDDLDWKYTIRPDTSRRKNLILNLEKVDAPGWTIEFWVVENARSDIAAHLLSEVNESQVLLCNLLVESTNPHILVFAWTMKPGAWQALMRDAGPNKRIVGGPFVA